MKQKYIFKTKQILLTIVITAAGLSGCKKFLDVNKNPNNPEQAESTLLLPASQAAMGQIIGNAFQIYGNMWAQFWTQNPTSSQYTTIDQYNPSASGFDRPWLTLYRNGLYNVELIINDPAPNLEFTKGIAYLIKAYTYQVTTDAFGDVPLKEALQPTVYTSPHFDKQELVYDSIFNYIDKGVALIKKGAPSPGDQDVIFQGDLDSWIAFANTLKLKAYLRLAYIAPSKAEAGVRALYATNPTFLTTDASIKYNTTGGNENPLHNEMVALGRTQNIVASSTIDSAFTQNNDPRFAKLYDLIDDDDEANTARSIAQGSYRANTGKTVSPPSPLVGGRASNSASAIAPVKFFSISESKFLQAEAALRTWGTGDAATLYEDGITASFTAVGIADLPGNTPVADYIEVHSTVNLGTIITQKYYAMCGFQGFEAWTEWRRTGYPTFFVQSKATTRAMPLRMKYPNSEAITNLNFPGLVDITTPVWWDVNPAPTEGGDQ